MPARPFRSRAASLTLIALAGLAVPALPALASGWERSNENGLAIAGARNDSGASMSFRCADPAAAEADPDLSRGPAMTVSLPGGTDTIEMGLREIEIVVDGQVFLVPVAFTPDGDGTRLDWEPSDDWTASQMETLVDAMQIGDEIVVDEGGADATFALRGAESALEDIFACD